MTVNNEPENEIVCQKIVLPDTVEKEYKYKTKYTVIVRELSDGDTIETEGVIEGLTTVILKDGKLKIGGVVRNTHGEIL